MAQPGPEPVLGGRTHTGSEDLLELRCLPSPSLPRGPAASAQPSPPASCLGRSGVEAAETPPPPRTEPGRGGGPGRGGPRSAPSRRPLGPTSSPPPLTGSAPGRDAQEACCFARGSAEVERSCRLPRPAGLCEQPARSRRRRRRRGAFGAASLVPGPQRGRRGAGRGSRAREQLETGGRDPKQMRKEENKTKWRRQERLYRG